MEVSRILRLEQPQPLSSREGSWRLGSRQTPGTELGSSRAGGAWRCRRVAPRRGLRHATQESLSFPAPISWVCFLHNKPTNVSKCKQSVLLSPERRSGEEIVQTKPEGGLAWRRRDRPRHPQRVQRVSERGSVFLGRRVESDASSR